MTGHLEPQKTIRLGPLFGFLFCLLLAFTSREPPWADAHVTYETTKQLVDEGRLDVNMRGPEQLFVKHNGYTYGVFPLGNVFGMIPSHLAYKAACQLRAWAEPAPDPKAKRPPPPIDPREDPAYWFTAHVAPTIWMAAACVLLFAMARRRMKSERGALALALVSLFCTPLVIYARATYSEALQTFILLWVVERTLIAGERPSFVNLGWLGVAAGIFVNTKLVNVLLLPSAFVYLVHQRATARGENRLAWGGVPQLLLRSLAALGAFVPFVAIALFHNELKTGSLWDSGYRIANGIFSGDLFAGLYGLLFSSGKSVFLYAPPVVLALLGARQYFAARRAESLLLLSLIAVSLLYNAKFRHWHADYCWGPRHIVSLLPLAMLFAAPVFDAIGDAIDGELANTRTQLIRLFAALGGFVQLLGASIYWDHYIRILIEMKDRTGAADWFRENLSHGHYIPGFSPLQGHLWIWRTWLTRDTNPLRTAPWQHVLPQGFGLDSTLPRARLDWWLLDWAVRWGWPNVIGGVVLLVLLIGAAMCWRAVSADRSRST